MVNLTLFFEQRKNGTNDGLPTVKLRPDLEQLMAKIEELYPCLRLPKSGYAIGNLLEMHAKRRVHTTAAPLKVKVVSIWLADFVTMLWQECGDVLKSWLLNTASSSSSVSSTSFLAQSWHALKTLIVSALPDAESAVLLEPTGSETVVESILMHSLYAAGVEVDKHLVQKLVAPLCVSFCEPCELLARTVCRSDIMEEVLGCHLRRTLFNYMHYSQWHLDVPEPEDQSSVAQVLLQELVETRQKLTELKSVVAAGSGSGMPRVLEQDLLANESESLVLRPAKRGRRELMMDLKSEWVKFVINSNIAFKHAPNTVAAAEQLMHFQRTGHNVESADALSLCFSARTVAKHTAVLDAALDLFVAEKIQKAQLLCREVFWEC